MIELEEIRDILKDKNLKQVSEKSGVNYTTLWKICRYRDRNTSYDTVKKLSDYILNNEFYQKNGHFDWDGYARVAKYTDVISSNNGTSIGLPVGFPSVPTMLSHDNKMVYFNSIDLECKVDDIDMLNAFLLSIYDDIKNRHTGSHKGSFDSSELYYLTLDYVFICQILKNHDALPADYKFPEYYIAMAISGEDYAV